ncbi:hypothetical protein B0F90DRAFT_1644394, partial [Multifurca ochricompacta]
AVATNKLAMSRALGAAFLTHQVEQLEKSVSGSASPRSPPPYRNNNHHNNNNNNNNWRDRQPRPPNYRTHPQLPVDSNSKRGQLPIGGIRITTNTNSPSAAQPPHQYQKERPPPPALRKQRANGGQPSVKQADVVVVDASVLVNALGQVKKWCRDGQEEILIVPLEALNTLDLLKKGSTPLAQRARTASRVLESQVGTNPRVRVQQDSAFVLWDKIAFHNEDDSDDSAHPTNSPPLSKSTLPSPSPEWVRRTICCAQWETENADPARPRVVLATLAGQPPPIQTQALGGVDAPVTSPVPLPVASAHHHHGYHANRHEPRVMGAFVTYWARRARLEVLEVQPSPSTVTSSTNTTTTTTTTTNTITAPGAMDGGRTSPEDRRPPLRGGHNNHYHRPGGRGGGGGGGGMVERPPAVKTMMDVISQPSRVVRVLARGEKLEP